jgi:hypothetical protein
MTPGQTSDALRVKLRQVGSRITDRDLVEAYGLLEASRRRFAADSVSVGMFFLAKKEAVGHGKWIPWCEKFAKLAHGANLTVAGGTAPRTIRKYALIAEHFLADLEQGCFAPDGVDAPVTAPKVTVDQVLSLQILAGKKRHAVVEHIEEWIGGRSLRRMLIDFRRAEHAADQEESEHEKQKAAKKNTSAHGSSDAAAGQLEFYQDMLRPIGEIETLFDTKSFVEKTDKAFWLGIAQKLTAQAERARQLADQLAE